MTLLDSDIKFISSVGNEWQLSELNFKVRFRLSTYKRLRAETIFSLLQKRKEGSGNRTFFFVYV